MFGYLPDPVDARDRLTPLSLSRGAVPAEIDLRVELLPVINQGSVGCCVGAAFADVAWREFQLAGRAAPQLSRLFTYWGARRRAGTQTYDAGCYPRDACAALQKVGAASESFWPETEPWSHEPDAGAWLSAVGWRISSYHRVETTSELESELADGHLVMYGFGARGNFLDVGSDGDYAPDSSLPIIGGHAVVAVGYRSGRVLTRNSWGRSWGEAGHFWMRYEDWDACVSDAWAVRA